MTIKDKEEVRSMLHDIIAGYKAEVQSQYNLISLELKYIKEQTTKTNGRTSTNEEKLQNLQDETSTLKTNLENHQSFCHALPLIDQLQNTDSDTRLKILEGIQLKKQGAVEYVKMSVRVILTILLLVSTSYTVWSLFFS